VLYSVVTYSIDKCSIVCYNVVVGERSKQPNRRSYKVYNNTGNSPHGGRKERAVSMKPICVVCRAVFSPKRRKIGKTTCLDCGDKQAHQVKHTVAPLNKSNYMLFTDVSMLKQLNPKRTT